LLAETRDADPDPRLDALWDRGIELFGRWDAASRRSIAAMQRGDAVGALNIRSEEVAPLRRELETLLEDGIRRTEESTEGLIRAATNSAGASRKVIWTAL